MQRFGELLAACDKLTAVEVQRLTWIATLLPDMTDKQQVELGATLERRALR